MKLATFNQFLLSLSCISLLVGLSVFNHAGTIAQPKQSAAEKFRSRIRAKNTKLTGRQKARGSRNDSKENVCGTVDPTKPGLTAIVPALPKPKNEMGSHTHYTLGVTTQEEPTFWFYLPYRIDRSRSATFELLLDDQLVPGGEEKFQLPSQPGLYSLQLSRVTLQTGKTYSWTFKVTCVPGDESANHDVSGWVKRIEAAELQQQLKRAKTPRQKLEVYVNQGIWHDSMSMLTGEVCREDLKFAQKEFNNFLQALELKEIVDKTPQPLLTKCGSLSK